MLPSANENSERESNLIPKPVYMYLSGSTFLVSFTDPISNYLMQNLYLSFLAFIAILGMEILLFIKQCPLKFKYGNI